MREYMSALVLVSTVISVALAVTYKESEKGGV